MALRVPMSGRRSRIASRGHANGRLPTMDVIAGIDAARERWNVLEHPFYTRWEQGELTREELARAARTARLHADEEAQHIALWDDFASALGSEHHEPLPQTRCCVSA